MWLSNWEEECRKKISQIFENKVNFPLNFMYSGLYLKEILSSRLGKSWMNIFTDVSFRLFSKFFIKKHFTEKTSSLPMRIGKSLMYLILSFVNIIGWMLILKKDNFFDYIFEKLIFSFMQCQLFIVYYKVNISNILFLLYIFHDHENILFAKNGNHSLLLQFQKETSISGLMTVLF